MVFAPTPQGYDAMRWTFTGVAVILTFGRFYIRWKYSRINWDDIFNGLALGCLIACFAAQDLQFQAEDYSAWLKYELAFALLFWTTQYLVKASFLALCLMIFKVSTAFRTAWLFVAVYNFLTYLAVILWCLWDCGNPSSYDDPVACSTNPDDNRWYHIKGQAFEAALHSSSESLVLALPLIWIKNLQMSRAQKVSAAAVFAIAIIDIIMGLLRLVSEDLYFQGYAQDTLLVLVLTLQAFEPGLAVIVCALPAYKVLLPGLRKQRECASPSIQTTTKPVMAPRRSQSTQTLETSSHSDEPKTAEMV